VLVFAENINHGLVLLTEGQKAGLVAAFPQCHGSSGNS
jgi:hypothetical protein